MATLVDTGPLVALVDRGQGEPHHRCVEVLPSLSLPLVTTWPCLTEAMYFLGKGWNKQAPLWKYLEDNRLEVHQTNSAEMKRMRALMEKYRDTPMDLADASLVASAETRQLRRIFTLDSDFRVYLANDKEPFEIVP